MATLKNRIETLRNRTSDLTVRQICESVLELTDHVPTKNLSSLIRERLKELDSQDAHAQRFMISEKRLARLEDMGISRALDRIKLTGVWDHNPRIQYILETYEKNKIMNIPDFLIAEQFIAQMAPFCYDPSINEAVDVVRNIQKALEEDIAVSTTIHLLENSRASKFYSPLVSNLKEYLENKSQSMRSVVISEMETYAYEPVVRDLQNKLKVYESNSNKSKFHITATSADYLVNPVYSFVLVERNADYFSIDGNFFKKVDEQITPLSVEAMARINERFVELNMLLTEENISVDREKISYVYGNNTMQIRIDDKAISYNGKPLKIQEVNNKLVEAGVFRWNQQNDLNKFNTLFEHVDTLCEIDFAKVISSKNHPGIQATIMRLGGSVTVIKNNPIMNENKVFTGLNGTQARNIILEFLNYDISESLVEFLSSENRAINQIENERREILNQIDECERNILKIEEAQQDILVSGSDEISAIKSELTFEVTRLKEQYAIKTKELNKLRTFEGNDEDFYEGDAKTSKKGKGASAYVQSTPDRDFGIGDLVVVDGEDGRIVGVDSVRNKATVLLKSGDSVSSEFSELELKVEESFLNEGKKSKGSKGVSAFTQQTPERAFSIGDMVDVADKGVGKITGIDSAEKLATVMFTSGTQSKVTFPEMRLASDEEVEQEEEYSEETSSYGKKKTQSTYVQETPQIDFRVGETVNVIGKGLAKITAIDSIRHVAIVMLQNGQQSEEEFSNLRSMESEIEATSQDNYTYGVSMGSMPNVSEQPLESNSSIYEEEYDEDDEGDYTGEYEGEYDDDLDDDDEDENTLNRRIGAKYAEDEEFFYGNMRKRNPGRKNKNDDYNFLDSVEDEEEIDSIEDYEPSEIDIELSDRWAKTNDLFKKGIGLGKNIEDEEEYIGEMEDEYDDDYDDDEDEDENIIKRRIGAKYAEDEEFFYGNMRKRNPGRKNKNDDYNFLDSVEDEEEIDSIEDYEPSEIDIELADRWSKTKDVVKKGMSLSKNVEDEEDYIGEMEEEYEGEGEEEYYDETMLDNSGVLEITSKDALLAKEKDSDYVFYDDELDLPDFNLPKPQYVGGKVKAHITDNYADSFLANQEVLIDESVYYNSHLDEAIEVEIDGVLDFVPKRFVKLIEK